MVDRRIKLIYRFRRHCMLLNRISALFTIAVVDRQPDSFNLKSKVAD